MKKWFVIISGVLSVSASFAQTWDEVLSLKKIPNPEGVDPQIGAVGTLPNGNIIAAFHRGEIMVFSNEKNQWLLWGNGLHEPLGMYVENDNSIIVIQRSELTRIADTDGDGTADHYVTLADDWGMSGNYHEFAFGAVKSPDGHFFIGLGTASNNGGPRPEIRGEWNDAGGISLEKANPNWKPGGRGMLPRMWARVPYRGWVIKVDPMTGTVTPYASGLRTPHGMHVTPEGELYVNDNQGDWLGSSKLYKIEKGKFYGHADSLVWTKGWDRGTPANLPPEELDKLRTKSVAYIPQGDLANSPTQIITLPKEGFGPYSGSMIMGEMNQARLVRYMPDVVNGKEQGSVISFMEHPAIGRGNSKLTLGKKGQLYIGKTHLSWAGARGLLRFQYNEDVPHLAITGVKLTENGFLVTLNKPAKSEGIGINASHYKLNYFKRYGSPKVDLAPVNAKEIKVVGNTIDIILDQAPKADFIYDIELTGVQSEEKGKLLDTRFFYTVHQVISQE